MLTLLDKGCTVQETADKLHCVTSYVEKFAAPEPPPPETVTKKRKKTG